MKGLKEFLEALKNNEGLRAEVEKVQGDTSKIVEIAKKHGYEFTETEFNDAKMDAVSGGEGFLDTIKNAGQKVFQGAVEGVKSQFTNSGQQGQGDAYSYGMNSQGQWFRTNNSTKRVEYWNGSQYVLW